MWAKRKDANHRDIVEAFQVFGWTVCDCSRAPYCPDLFVAKAGRVIAIEIKVKGGKRKAHQQVFGDRWAGEYALVTSVEQVIREFGCV